MRLKKRRVVTLECSEALEQGDIRHRIVTYPSRKDGSETVSSELFVLV
jgi:hypothetical protein